MSVGCGCKSKCGCMCLRRCPVVCGGGVSASPEHRQMYVSLCVFVCLSMCLLVKASPKCG